VNGIRDSVAGWELWFFGSVFSWALNFSKYNLFKKIY
jgi:hypothetical protein